jgi:hypothetical protein
MWDGGRRGLGRDRLKCTKIVGVEGDDAVKKKKNDAGWKAQLIK